MRKPFLTEGPGVAPQGNVMVVVHWLLAIDRPKAMHDLQALDTSGQAFVR